MKGIPQILIIALLAMSLGIRIAEYEAGKQTRKEVISGLISTAVWLVLLTWGGFFS